MLSLSSHVLDTTSGKPVANLPIELLTPDGQRATVETDDDGRCKTWPDINLVAGCYQLRFLCKPYLLEQYGKCFYPYVDIHFELESDGGHYHVPLLISPFGFSSYRGS